MKAFEFKLKFQVPLTDDMSEYDARLMEYECLDDAFFGTDEQGLLEIDFDREAVSIEEALKSALSDVMTAIPDAQFLEVHPGFGTGIPVAS